MAALGSTEINPRLTAVIPIGGRSPNLTYLLSWLTSDVLKKIKVIIIFDGLEHETSLEFHRSLTHLISSNLKILETNNKNPGGARNCGIDSVDTMWMAFWDADDIPGVSQVLSVISECSPSTTVIRGGYSIRNLESGETNVVDEEKLSSDLSILFKSGPGLWRYVFKTKNFSGLRFPELSMAEDQIYLFKALESIESIAEASENIYTYQVKNSDQLTSSKEKLDDLLGAFEYLLDEHISSTQIKNSSFETIIARMMLTSRLKISLFAKVTYKFISVRQLSLETKSRILARILKQLFFGLRLR